MRLNELAIACFVFGCGSGDVVPKSATDPHAERVSRCEDYSRAVDEARQAHPGLGDETDVEGMNACGCKYTIHTTTALAAKVNAAFQQWTRDNCGPVNCDTPCSGQVVP